MTKPDKATENKEPDLTEAKTIEKVKAAGKPRIAENGTQEKTVYMGPTLRGISISGTVYIGGIPKALEEAAKSYTVIKELIVPMPQFIEASKKLSDKDSAFRTFYRLIEEWEMKRR